MKGKFQCKKCHTAWTLPEGADVAYTDITLCMKRKCPFAVQDTTVWEHKLLDMMEENLSGINDPDLDLPVPIYGRSR